MREIICETGIKALVLAPCCWPRRREFARGDEVELRELARLMCLKASSLDTYTSWAQHLWETLAAAAAAAADSSTGSNGDREIVVGVSRDRDVLSDKNLLLTALKVKCSCRAPAPAHKRYAATAGVGAWCRYAALREVYGMPIEQRTAKRGGAGPGARPHPRLRGNVKPLQSLLSSQDPGEDITDSSNLETGNNSASSNKGRKRRRQQAAVDDAIILRHVVSHALSPTVWIQVDLCA